MGRISVEDIIGYEIDGELVCTECIEKEKEDAVAEDQILTEDDRKDGDVRLFCDCCKKEL